MAQGKTGKKRTEKRDQKEKAHRPRRAVTGGIEGEKEGKRTESRDRKETEHRSLGAAIGGTGEPGTKKAVGIYKPGDWRERPRTKEAVQDWVKQQVNVWVMGEALEYLAWAFLEGSETATQRVSETGQEQQSNRAAEQRIGTDATRDSVVWACRGGGKTFIAAMATALDLLFKPGIQVRLIAGSVEQGQKMYEHLRAIFEKHRLFEAVKGRITERRVRLNNGSEARLLAPTQASVRGVRVHKLRIDEVELMNVELWEAVQLATRSEKLGEIEVKGSVEVFSTMHDPGGMMSRLTEECKEGKRRLFKWGVVEVLEKCGRECWEGNEQNGKLANEQMGAEGGNAISLPQMKPCVLWAECGGAAKLKKEGEGGHVRVGDAIAMKRRVDPEVWDAEMLCARPRRTNLVLREFVAERHTYSETAMERDSETGREQQSNRTAEQQRGAPCVADSLSRSASFVVCGMDFGIRSPTVVLWGVVGGDGVLRVVDERIVKGEVLEMHIDAILRSPWGVPAWVGIDPAGRRRNDQTGVSSAEAMRRAGLRVRWREGAVQYGLSRVRARLSPADGSPPRLMVHERCKELIRSLERYRYDPERPLCVEPLKDGNDHAVDALRYMVVSLDAGWEVKVTSYI